MNSVKSGTFSFLFFFPLFQSSSQNSVNAFTWVLCCPCSFSSVLCFYMIFFCCSNIPLWTSVPHITSKVQWNTNFMSIIAVWGNQYFLEWKIMYCWGLGKRQNVKYVFQLKADTLEYKDFGWKVKNLDKKETKCI